MDKMKRIFSFVLVFAILAGSFASFSTVAYADTAVATEGTEVLKKVPADVIGTEHEDAVRRLVAFGIIGGYPDGSYKPERVVNRAQFAKIIVEALGLRDAVPAAEGQSTGFKDVAGDYWAAGYINVASGQGLIKGYPDGTFKPAREVTYAQALTMLVRALGYQDEFLRGTWPGNYVSKAADVGITAGVKIPSNAQEAAKRGYVAELVNNALDAKVVKVDTYKPNTGSVEYYETEIPLLKDKLEISKYEDTRIIADKIVDDGLDKDEVRVRFLESTDRYRNDRRYNRGEVVKKEFAKGAEETFRYYADVNPRELIGEEITTYIDDNDKVIYVEDERDDKANFDFVEGLDKNDRLELVNFDKEYDFETKTDEEATVWVHNGKDKFNLYNSERDLKDLKREDLVGRMGKVVVKNNRIVYAEFQKASDVSSEFLLVRENKDGNLMGVTRTTADQKIDLRKDKDYDYALVYNTKGEKIALKDIEKGNIVYIDEIDYDGDDVALVTVVQDNEIDGKVGKVKNDRIEIDGKEIKVVKTSAEKLARYTNDGYDEIRTWDEKETWEDDMEDAYKQNAKVYTDATGRIAFLEIGAGDSGYKFGIVTRTYADGDRIRIYTSIDGKEGNDQIFKADKERDLTSARLLNEDGVEYENYDNKNRLDKNSDQSLLGSAVKFRLNSNGEISDGKFFVMPVGATYGMTDDFGKDVIKAKKSELGESTTKGGGISFVVPTDSTQVISAEGFTTEVVEKLKSYKGVEAGNLDGLANIDIDDFDVTTWKDIKEDNHDSEVKFYIFPKNSNKREVEGLVFVGKDGASTGTDEIAIYVLNRQRAGSDIEIEYVSYENNEKQTRVLSNDDRLALDGTKVKKEMAYAAKEKSNGKIEVFGKLSGVAVDHVYGNTDTDYDVYRNVTVESVDGNYIKTNILDKESNKVKLYVSGALIYDEDKTKSISYLDGKVVDVVTDGIRTRVVSVVDDTDKPSKPEQGIKDGEYIFQGFTTIDGTEYVLLEDSNGNEVEYPVTDEVKKDNADLATGSLVEIKSRKVAGKEVVYKMTKVELEVESVSADNGTVTVKFNRALVDEDLTKVNAMKATAKDGDTDVNLENIKVDPAAKAGDKEVKMTFTALTNDTAKDMNVVVTVDGKDAKAFVVKADEKAVDTEKLNADKALIEELTIEIPKETTEQADKTAYVQGEVDKAIKNDSKAVVTSAEGKYSVELTNGKAEKVTFELKNVTEASK